MRAATETGREPRINRPPGGDETGFLVWTEVPPASASPPSAVLDAARRGDENAYAEIVEPHRPELHAHCYRMLGSLHDAEDALQEALLRAWRGLPKFEGRSSP